ncbi:MAG TPA: nuclear transport factor 2 family protein [Solirubrobacteraceae bacterium]|jgi:ketosteroid isomerase-like protein|nr:nuclear transport factor 2 family protein [Solirubrobacteraceae bacterium]
MPGEGGQAMARKHVEIVKELTRAFHRRDIDAFAKLTTADVEWVPVFSAQVERTVYRGREGIETFLREVTETWDEFRPIPEEYRDVGDRVLALGRLRARGRSSGAPVDAPWAGIFDFRISKVCRIRTYLDHAEALNALG